MSRMLRTLLAQAAGLVLVAGQVSAAVTGNPPAPYGNWLNRLESAGYTIKQGWAYALGPTNCQRYVDIFGSCAANNPATPYIVVQPPIVDGEFIDPYYGHVFGTNVFTENSPLGVPVNEIYRVTDGEALVVVVDLPPKAAYFGYQSYAFTRDAARYPVKGQLSQVIGPPDPNRRTLVASIGNPVNNSIINRATGLLPQASPWGGQIATITTSNQSLDSAIRASFRQSSGVQDNVLFTEPFGANLYTGLDESADELYTVFRYTIHEDETAAQDWLTHVGTRTWVYRITAPAGIAVNRFPTPTLNPRLANDESALQPSLDELRRLLTTWVRSNRNPVTTSFTARSSVTVDRNGVAHGIVGPQCIEKGRYCVADTLDTEAYRYVNIGAMDNDDVALVAGVNHTARNTDNSYYEALGIYDGPTVTGIASIAQSNPTAAGFVKGEMTGTAYAALQKLGLLARASARLLADSPDLYVASVSRHCDATLPNCIDITEAQVPLRHRIIVNQRAYLKPGGMTGANPNLLLNPLVVRTKAVISLPEGPVPIGIPP